MLGAPCLSFKIHPLIRGIPSPFWLRQVSVITTGIQASTRHRPEGEAKETHLPVTAPQAIQIANDLNLGMANEAADSRGKYYSNATGRTHHRPITPIYTHAQRTRDRVGEILRIIATTQSSDDAWHAYRLASTITVDPTAKQKYIIPHAHFHRLARLLASTKPRTRTLFLRLLSVLASLKKEGGTIHGWEWNALIDCAGKGWRKTRPEDYKAALDVFNDMVSQNGDGNDMSTMDQKESVAKTAVANRDIFTYTTMLYIACRTLMPATVRHAGNLLQSSGVRPNQVTHLSMLRYFSRTRQLSGVRSTIMRMREQGFEFGIDGINACMTAFMRNSRMDIASTIYRVLRHHVVPEPGIGEHDIHAAIRYLDVVEGIVIAEDMIPDRISYTIIIQGLAYSGDLIQSLQVFTHMLSSPDIEPFAPRVPDKCGKLRPAGYPSTLPVFRALFLGFVRHAQPPLSQRQKQQLSTRLKNHASPPSPWTLRNLDLLFKSFLELPVGTRPSDRTVYWILVAFAKTGGNDVKQLRKVWSQMEARFEGRWGGRLDRFKKRIHGEIPGRDEWEH